MKQGYLALLYMLILLVSCASTEKEILENPNVTVQILKIREQAFLKRYKLSERLYQEVKQANLDDVALQIEIDYEIAYLYVKRKKYQEAKEQFETIIARYELSTEGSELPQWPYYLSKKIVDDVITPELEKPPFFQRIFNNKEKDAS